MLAVHHTPWIISATSIGVAGVLASLIGAIVAYAVWLVGVPRKVLIVSLDDKRYTPSWDKSWVTVILRNGSLRDIPSSQFDNGDPIVLDLGVPIISVGGADRRVVNARCAGETLLVGPCLIRTRERLKLHLSVDDRFRPGLHCASNPLIDGAVRLPWQVRRRRRKFIVAWSITAILNSALLIGLHADPHIPAYAVYLAIFCLITYLVVLTRQIGALRRIRRLAHWQYVLGGRAIEPH